MKRVPCFTTKFLKDIRLMEKRGKNINKLKAIMAMLNEGIVLPPILRDHKLSGELKNNRECHIESDWLLVYTIEANSVRYERTGSHSDLFE
jgi:mRNA interferase YafQ